LSLNYKFRMADNIPPFSQTVPETLWDICTLANPSFEIVDPDDEFLDHHPDFLDISEDSHKSLDISTGILGESHESLGIRRPKITNF